MTDVERSNQPSSTNTADQGGQLNLVPGHLAPLLDACLRDFTEAGISIDRALLARFAASLLAKRFVLLTGLSGSGKTKLAQSIATWLTSPAGTQGDPFTPGAAIPAANINYVVRSADSVSVEFTNPDLVRVALPRELIGEWVACIEENGFTDSTPARTIREAASNDSRYSSQLHSFETHLRAAAFAVIRARTSTPTSAHPYAVVSVGADWTSNEAIVGYPDGLDPTRYVRTQALDVILSAVENPGTPHFLILDEMNLSHVERYFSDVLSAIESGEPIILYKSTSAELRSGVPTSVRLPPNLFIIGTVNVDETTYMFSPKVLDRANVIEFRVEEAELSAFLGRPRAIQLERLAGRGARFATQWLRAASSEISPRPNEELSQELMLFFRVLQQQEGEFGFRVAKEIIAFTEWHQQLGAEDESIKTSMDAQIIQKLLPKLHGSRQKLEPTLWALASLCDFRDVGTKMNELEARAKKAASFDDQLDPLRDLPTPSRPRYPLSFDKIRRMIKRLHANGFTSFSEA